jgi:hypothetical protein
VPDLAVVGLPGDGVLAAAVEPLVLEEHDGVVLLAGGEDALKASWGLLG